MKSLRGFQGVGRRENLDEVTDDSENPPQVKQSPVLSRDSRKRKKSCEDFPKKKKKKPRFGSSGLTQGLTTTLFGNSQLHLQPTPTVDSGGGARCKDGIHFRRSQKANDNNLNHLLDDNSPPRRSKPMPMPLKRTPSFSNRSVYSNPPERGQNSTSVRGHSGKTFGSKSNVSAKFSKPQRKLPSMPGSKKSGSGFKMPLPKAKSGSQKRDSIGSNHSTGSTGSSGEINSWAKKYASEKQKHEATIHKHIETKKERAHLMKKARRLEGELQKKTREIRDLKKLTQQSQMQQEASQKMKKLEQEFNLTQSQLRQREQELSKSDVRIKELELLLDREKRSWNGFSMATVSVVTKLMEYKSADGSKYMLQLTRELCNDELGEELGNLLATSDVPSLIQFMIKIFNHRNRLGARAVVCACNILVLMFTTIAPEECIDCILNLQDNSEVIQRIPKKWRRSRFEPQNSRINLREKPVDRPEKKRKPQLKERHGRKFMEELFHLLESISKVPHMKKADIQLVQKQIVRLILVLLQHEAKTDIIERLCWNKGLILDLLTQSDDVDTKSHIIAILLELLSRATDLTQRDELHTIQDGMSSVDIIFLNLFDDKMSLHFRHRVLLVIDALAHHYPQILLFRTKKGEKLPVNTIGEKNRYLIVPRLAQLLDSLNWDNPDEREFAKSILLVVAVLIEHCEREHPKIAQSSVNAFVGLENLAKMDEDAPDVFPYQLRRQLGWEMHLETDLHS